MAQDLAMKNHAQSEENKQHHLRMEINDMIKGFNAVNWKVREDVLPQDLMKSRSRKIRV